VISASPRWSVNGTWSIERNLQLNIAAVGLGTAFLAITKDRRWDYATCGALGFFLLHSLDGFIPPMVVFRQFGIRTRAEIDREIYALKLARGDFEDVDPSTPTAETAETAAIAVGLWYRPLRYQVLRASRTGPTGYFTAGMRDFVQAGPTVRNVGVGRKLIVKVTPELTNDCTAESLGRNTSPGTVRRLRRVHLSRAVTRQMPRRLPRGVTRRVHCGVSRDLPRRVQQRVHGCDTTVTRRVSRAVFRQVLRRLSWRVSLRPENGSRFGLASGAFATPRKAIRNRCVHPDLYARQCTLRVLKAQEFSG
jgi:hypothetical protein